MARSRLRPLSLIVGVALLAGALFATAGAANSAPELPAVPAEQLAASVASALKADPTVSGNVDVHIDLGLPALPDGTAPELGALPVGDRRLSLWRSPDGVRVAELADDNERAFIANRDEAWTWDAAAGTATHTLAPSDAQRAGRASHHDGDPLAHAQRALDAIAPSTEVTVETTARVAGRDAYVLALTPRSEDTLVGRVELAVDAERRLPLRYSVFSRGGGEPPIEVAFTRVSYEPIDAATFTLTPPAGTEVTEKPAPERRGDAGAGDPRDQGDKRVFGEAWTTVVAAPIDAPAPEMRQLLPYSGPLFSAQLVERGGQTWVLGGPVPSSRLDAVAADLP